MLETVLSDKGYEQFYWSEKLCRRILRQLKDQALGWKIDPHYQPSVKESTGELEYSPCLAIQFPSDSLDLFTLVSTSYKRGIPKDIEAELAFTTGEEGTEPARRVFQKEKQDIYSDPVTVSFFPSHLWNKRVSIPKEYRATFRSEASISTKEKNEDQ
ncbi:MAG: hypothetical protein LUC43_04950 [Burkholderiales bacterium]|nr:hypothetical protein [Burkholderiales bacterium]